MQTYEDARRLHGTVAKAEDLFKKKGADICENVWRSLTDVDFDPEPYTFEEALRMSMPFDAISTVRSGSGVAAAFVVDASATSFIKDRPYVPQAKQVWALYAARAALANNVQDGYGCDKSASWELAREVAGHPDARVVEQIAKLAGRMYKTLHGARKVPTNDPHEVKGVELGGDIERLTADELTQLMTPGLDDMAAIRVLEKRSQQYKMKGKMAASKGPLVICLDESGSMHDDGYGQRNTWAKACALALARVAHDGNRMVSIVHFATSCTVTKCPPGDSQALLDMSRHFLDGGTDIARALTVGAREVGNLALQGFIGADIVMVTDGEDGSHAAQDRILGLMQGQGVRLWTVLIECDLQDKAPLKARAQEVIRVAGTERADLVAALRGAADNYVSDEDKKADEARKRQHAAMN